MRTCYFCTTPFQIMSSISMAIAYEESADLYIMDQFANADDMGDILCHSKIFQNVKVVHEHEICGKYICNGKIGGLYNCSKVVMAYLHVDEIAGNILVDNAEYKKMYIARKSHTARYVMLHFIKHHSNIEIVHFDDGEGSYDNLNCYNPTRMDALVRRILFGRNSIDNNKNRILYSPELYHLLNPDSTINVKQMPCLWKDEPIKTVINSMFNFEKSDIPQEKVIVLDPIRNEVFNEDELKAYAGICDYIYNTFRKENVIIKKHPRDVTNDERFSYYSKNFMPFEVLSLNSSISSKIIIAYASTAIATPKLIFDEEPIVILLYKLIKKDKADGKVLAYYESCRNLYKNKCFYIPETEEELYNIVEELIIT